MHIATATFSIRHFAHRHDDIPAFHAGYLVLTLLSAALFNLGTFAVLILIHMGLDLFKYREHLGYGWKLTFEGMVRESLLDITLLTIGLVFSVYLHHTVAFVGISGLMRTELTVLRLFGTLIPKVKILHNFLKVMAHLRHYLDHTHAHLRQHWSGIDRVCLFSIGLCSFLLFFAAPLLHTNFGHIGMILSEELIPSIL